MRNLSSVKLLSGAIAAILLAISNQTNAHVVYPSALFNDTGVDLAHTGKAPNLTGFGTGTQTFTATSNVGWYSASTAGLNQASADWNNYRAINGGVTAGATSSIAAANSHDVKFLYFDLSQESKISFTINANTTTSGQTASGALQPGFSIYQGLAPYLAHDGAADNPQGNANTLKLDPNGFAPWSQFLIDTPVASTGNNAALWGTYRSDANFGIGHDMGAAPTAVNNYPNGDPVNGFNYNDLNLVGYATNTGLESGALSASGGANTVTATFDLQPGVYTLTVGGTDTTQLDPYMQALFGSIGLPMDVHTNCAPSAPKQCVGFTDAVAQVRQTYGFNITTSVQAVPVPGAVWLFGSAMAGFVGVNRRKFVKA